METPPIYYEEFEQLSERLGWMLASMDEGKNIAQFKNFIAEIHAFYDKWHPLIQGSPAEAKLEMVRIKMMERLPRLLELSFSSDLLAVIETRCAWLAAEVLLRAIVRVATLQKGVPEHLRNKFDESIRNRMTGEYFDAEKVFRETERDADEREARFRKALDNLETNWPERVDATLREHLEKMQVDDILEWRGRITVQLKDLTVRKAGAEITAGH
jgi:hypothetical protein